MPSKILLVEDNPDTCEYLSLLLKVRGYEVRTASDGVEALKVMDTFSPDLIVSDIMMPRLDGIQLVQTLRNSPKYAKIPIITISAYGSGNLDEALKVGANKALRKPLDFDCFFRSLKTLLS